MTIRIGNCSGFYGDRLTAMREMVAGGPLDYLTGDYLAELTMLILGRDQMKDASRGYARTFVRQLEDCLGEILERGVTVVANAGGLNPAGLAARVEEVAAGLGLSPTVAHVAGDDLMPRAAELGLDGAHGPALTANAYLGGFGIADALTRGADVVVTGRVTDASLVVGPCVAAYGWTPADHDALAGAVVAGHVVECGPQATGGNFSGFLDLARDGRALGFPLAEVEADGSSVITKHEGTGGAVTVDTVTAQLMYEIQSSTYLNPDVAVDLDSVRLADDGPDRVRVSGVRGGPPPATLKVCVNTLGGFRNAAELVLTGLDAEAKADWVRAQLEARFDPRPKSVVWSDVRLPTVDAETEEGASVLLRVSVQDPDADVVGRAFSGAVVEHALASYPGFTMTAPPGSASPYGVYRPAYVERREVSHVVVVGGEEHVVPDPEVTAPYDAAGVSTSSFAGAQSGSTTGVDPRVSTGSTAGGRAASASERVETPAPDHGPTRRLPLGTFVHARSGDKGGDANVGLWVRQDGPVGRREARVAWLLGLVTPQTVRDLLPEAADLDVEVHPLPYLGGVNVLVRGLLGEGVAASTRFDPQAKGLGEHLRARLVDVPEELQ